MTSHFNTYKYILLLAILIVGFNPLSAQRLASVHMVDDFNVGEWVIYSENDSLEGTLELSFFSSPRLDEWSYRIGDATGTIREKFANSGVWEVDGPNDVLTFRTAWRNDLRSWKIGNGDINIQFESKYGNQFDEWITHTNRYGVFYMYSEWENDYRDWIIVDDSLDEVTIEYKMAMIFTALYSIIPKK